MIVGRMAVTVKTVDATSPSAPQPVVKPTSPSPGEERKETLAVDIPQGYFDPSRNAPAMRMFECPGCGRRLRCAATTKRVKCRTCESVIRFEGDTPVIERPESQNSAPSPSPAPQPAPQPAPAQTPSRSNRGLRWPRPDRRWRAQAVHRSPSVTAHPCPGFRLSTFWCTKSRAIWSFLRRHLDFCCSSSAWWRVAIEQRQ